MTIDLTAAARFLTTHARVLDRRRFDLRFGAGDTTGVLGALEGYRNPDGGYSWGLEPDLRAPESQPGGALHAFEALEDVAPVTSRRAVELCDWLGSVSFDDGGLPFARPIAEPARSAPFWAGADHDASSLHITSAVAGAAHRVARHDLGVRDHPWLERSTRYCLDTISAWDRPMHALELLFSLQFLDAASETHPEAFGHIERLGAAIPPEGSVWVEGGTETEFVGPLEFSPVPDRPVRALFAPDAVAAHLDQVAGRQLPDGGWDVEFRKYSPAAELEWRGYETVRALIVLRANGRV